MNTASPLAGIRVVELGSSVAVPYATWILATLGADVVKVERPETGDDCRFWGTGWYGDVSALFVALNAGKHSVVVDLKDTGQCAVLRRYILEHADVVVQNLRPGVADRISLGADELLGQSDRLIYVNCGAYGATGPLSQKPGYDPLMQAFCGLMNVTGEEGRPPVRVGTSIIDMGTGMWVAMGVLAALRNRECTGKGGRVDTSLYETALGWMTYHAAGYFGNGSIPERFGSSGPGIAPYQAYSCADGYLIIAAPNDRMFAKLSAQLGHHEWSSDPRFADNRKRWSNRSELNALIEVVTQTKPIAAWRAMFDESGIPSAPLQGIDEVLAQPQTEALGIVQQSDDGRYKMIGLPLSFDGARPKQHHGPPKLGDHTAEVFGDPKP